MKLKLFCNITNSSLVKSTSSDFPVSAPKIWREDDILLEITFVEATGSITNPVSVVDATNISGIKVGIGAIDVDLDAYQGTFTKTGNTFEGSLNIFTQNMVDAFNNTSAETIERWFEIEITEGNYVTTVFAEKITLHKDIITGNLQSPADVQAPTAFINTFMAAIVDTETVTWTQANQDIFAHINGLEAVSLTGEAGKVVTVNTNEDAFELSAASVGATDMDSLTDVDTSTNSPTDGQVIKWDAASSQWIPADDSTLTGLDGLTDVDTSTNSPTDGQVIKWDAASSKWIPADDDTGSGGASDMDSLTDADTSTNAPNTNDHLSWDGSNWIPSGNVISHTHDMDSLTDVDTSTNSPTDGQVIKWDAASSQWIPADDDTGSGGGGGATEMDDLTDVDTSTNSPSDGQTIKWDTASSKWIPADDTTGSGGGGSGNGGWFHTTPNEVVIAEAASNGTGARFSDGIIFMADGSDGLSSYKVDENDDLVHLDNDSTPSSAVEVWSDGKFVYVADATLGLMVYHADCGGQLTHLGSYNDGASSSTAQYSGVWGEAASNGGRFIYCSEQSSSGGIHVYSIDCVGNATHKSKYDGGGSLSVYDICVSGPATDSVNSLPIDGDPVNGFYNLIFAACGDDGVQSFSVSSSGVLTALYSATPTGSGSALALCLTGNALLLANGAGGLHFYSIETTAGSSYGSFGHLDEYQPSGGSCVGVFFDGLNTFSVWGTVGLHINYAAGGSIGAVLETELPPSGDSYNDVRGWGYSGAGTGHSTNTGHIFIATNTGGLRYYTYGGIHSGTTNLLTLEDSSNYGSGSGGGVCLPIPIADEDDSSSSSSGGMTVTTITNTDTVTIAENGNDHMVIVNNPNLVTDFTWNIPAPSSVPAGRKIIIVPLDVQASSNGGYLTVTAASGEIVLQFDLQQGNTHTDSITYSYASAYGEGVIGVTLIADGANIWVDTAYDDVDYWEAV